MEKKTVFIKKTVDDFHRVGDLNTKRIKAYNDIANEYTVSISVIRDIFSLGINFAIANMEEIELPSEEEMQNEIYHESMDAEHAYDFQQGAKHMQNFILNHLKSNTNG